MFFLSLLSASPIRYWSIFHGIHCNKELASHSVRLTLIFG